MLEKEGDRQSSGADAFYQKEEEFGKMISLIERGVLMLGGEREEREKMKARKSNES